MPNFVGLSGMIVGVNSRMVSLGVLTWSRTRWRLSSSRLQIVVAVLILCLVLCRRVQMPVSVVTVLLRPRLASVLKCTDSS